MVWPAVKFRFDAVGVAPPPGKTDRWPASFGLVTVTFSATALMPWGTPRRPLIWVEKVLRPPSWPFTVPRPSRVSTKRDGATGV